MALLKISKLQIAIGENTLVHDVSFSLCPAEILVIVGESGSGKTLIGRTISGTLDVKEFTINGEIEFENKLLGRIGRLRKVGVPGKDIAVIMQNPMTAFNPSIRMKHQLIESYMLHYKVSKKEALDKARVALNHVGLDDFNRIQNSYPFQLSGGMLQRVMIAITLMTEPKIIIADEPTTAVDPFNREMILDEMIKLKKQGISIVFITHDFYAVKKIANKVLVLNKGKLVEFASRDDVLLNPQNEYTKSLIFADSILKMEQHYA